MLTVADRICPECRNAATIAPFDPDSTVMPSRSAPVLESKVRLDSRAQLDRYGDRKHLRDWALGKVYSGFHHDLRCHVTIHTFEPSEDAFESDDSRELARQRFVEQVKVVAQLKHPNLPRVMEAGVVDGLVFVVLPAYQCEPILRFAPRRLLGRWREGSFPHHELVDLFRLAADAVSQLHQAGVVHGGIDVNSLVMIDGAQLLVDGLFSQSGPEDSSAEVAKKSDIVGLGHAVGSLVGWPNIATDKATDLPPEKLWRKVRARNIGVPKTLCQTLAKCVSRQPGGISSGQQLVDELAQQQPRAILASPRSRFTSAFFDLLSVAIISALIFPAVADSTTGASLYLISGMIVVFVLQEALFSTTIVRYFFALFVCDYSGQPAHWLRSLFRTILKWGLLAVAIVLNAVFVLAVGQMFPQFDTVWLPIGSALIFPLMFLVGPMLLMRSRLTLYDALTGSTWAELTPRTERGTAAEVVPEDLNQKPDLPAIDQVDQFEILRLLGEGGMGQVYLGYDQTIERQVAIKVLPTSFARDQDAFVRFQREARLAAKVRHEKIASILGMGMWRERPYIAMDVVIGDDLSDKVKKHGAQPIELVWDWLLQATEGLAAAAQHGIIHRDIKPSNLMLDHSGCIKVMDFGISFDPADSEDQSKSGVLIGTPTYMSPEQADRLQVDFRSDIYSLGLSAIFLLTGRKPFEGDTISILSQKMEGVDLSANGFRGLRVSRGQQAVIERMIETDRERRFQSYAELASALIENDQSKLEPAKVFQRATSTLIDVVSYYFITWIVLILLGLTLPRFMDVPSNPELLEESPGAASEIFTYEFVSELLSMSIPWAVFSLAFLFGMMRRGQSSGKRLLGLRVFKNDSSALGFFDALARYVVTLPMIAFVPLAFLVGHSLDWTTYRTLSTGLLIFNVVTLLASIILVLRFSEGRSLGDLLTGSRVMKQYSSK